MKDNQDLIITILGIVTIFTIFNTIKLFQLHRQIKINSLPQQYHTDLKAAEVRKMLEEI